MPYQGIRWDFLYEHVDHQPPPLFMIWPEFEDEACNIITDNSIPVPKNGTALMWIINAENRVYHRGKIEVGTKGTFQEGLVSVGICEVIEIIGLATNPTLNKR